MSVPRRSLLGRSLKAGSCGLLCSLLGRFSRTASGQSEKERAPLHAYAVGQVRKDGTSVTLRIFEPYRDALLGLDGFSHAFVLYWFDKNDTPERRGILRVHPRGRQDNPLTGVFACRAPVRPNLIGLTLCKVLSVTEGTVHIDTIDALDGSPIVDIKPYIPTIDSTTENLRLPDWL